MSINKIKDFFENLSDRGITVCEECSESNVYANRKQSDLGYCFYRPHEGIYANETGTLYLSWGAYSSDQYQMLIIVNAILDEAKYCGIDADWKGAITDRIVVSNLDKTYFCN